MCTRQGLLALTSLLAELATEEYHSEHPYLGRSHASSPLEAKELKETAHQNHRRIDRVV
jgi:hypothetical protein